VYFFSSFLKKRKSTKKRRIASHARVFRGLWSATKDAVLGTCKPLKRLERNFWADGVQSIFTKGTPYMKKPQDALRKLGLLFLNFVLFYVLLRLIILLAGRTGIMAIYYIGTSLYMLGAAGIFLAFFCLNGFTVNDIDRTWDDLPDNWPDERKRDFLAKQPERRKKARSLMYILLPMVLTIGINYIELTFLK
jgi:hypothetical protein